MIDGRSYLRPAGRPRRLRWLHLWRLAVAGGLVVASWGLIVLLVVLVLRAAA
jgi:hypothetical protein